jgi:predicted GNAT family acetyltransferase
MQIQHEERKKKGAFFIEKGGERLAELAYFKSAPAEMTIYHTEVSDELRGGGKGKELIKEAVKYARKHDLKIVATCPFAKKVLEGAPEFHDVLK